jgi:hypothetical protein
MPPWVQSLEVSSRVLWERWRVLSLGPALKRDRPRANARAPQSAGPGAHQGPGFNGGRIARRTRELSCPSPDPPRVRTLATVSQWLPDCPRLSISEPRVDHARNECWTMKTKVKTKNRTWSSSGSLEQDWWWRHRNNLWRYNPRNPSLLAGAGTCRPARTAMASPEFPEKTAHTA